jgi:type IV pilus assembly protein PilX
LSNPTTIHAMPMFRPRALRRTTPRRQSGVVLIIALIVLVAMALAGIALFRQVGTGLTIAGNLAFKQAATASADLGAEGARGWLVGAATAATPIDLNKDSLPGYYSSWDTSFDPATFDWSANATKIGQDATGNTISYIIHRLCALGNVSVNQTGQQCVTFGSIGAGGSKAAVSYGIMPLSNTVQPYFRVTTQVTGPRNTRSFVQVIMY